jgi:hypothetical protein
VNSKVALVEENSVLIILCQYRLRRFWLPTEEKRFFFSDYYYHRRPGADENLLTPHRILGAGASVPVAR